MLFNATGIVLNKGQYIGPHLILTIYTREYGKLNVMAKGAKNPKSKLKAGCEPFVVGRYTIFRQNEENVGHLKEVEPINSFRNISNSLASMLYAQYLLEIVNKITEDDAKDYRLFTFLYQCLQLLDFGIDPKKVRLFFDIHMLRYMGYFPELNHCTSCLKESEFYFLSITEGGLVCRDCKSGGGYNYKITRSMIECMKSLAKTSSKGLQLVNISESEVAGIQRILEHYLKYHANITSLKTLEVLKSMIR